MLTVLETLGPAERAVFVLRDVFEMPYEEIAEAVGTSPVAVRQIAHRARGHVAARRPRVPVSSAEQQQIVDRFLAAVRDGDVQSLLDVLAPDVVVIADGGGVVAAALRPIRGAGRVAGFLITAARAANLEVNAVWLNGSPGVRIDIDGDVDTAVSLAVENGRITRMYAVRNPHKLARLDGVAALTRS
jgi:RNA polymerase sigma-70 factor (ECF subfamily)